MVFGLDFFLIPAIAFHGGLVASQSFHLHIYGQQVHYNFLPVINPTSVILSIELFPRKKHFPS